eukprot:125841-Chlamydomonas_euryale.AAC.9
MQGCPGACQGAQEHTGCAGTHARISAQADTMHACKQQSLCTARMLVNTTHHAPCACMHAGMHAPYLTHTLTMHACKQPAPCTTHIHACMHAPYLAHCAHACKHPAPNVMRMHAPYPTHCAHTCKHPAPRTMRMHACMHAPCTIRVLALCTMNHAHARMCHAA